jgi:hypothetical protein
MIRLDTYPEAQIASSMTPQRTSLTTPILCCLLHTGPLPASHQLEVWVGGVRQTAEQEGRPQVFSWQCGQNVEMTVQLLQQGRLRKAWRGWWQGDTTIAHTGTLAVQVFCAGTLQPAGLAPRSTSIPSAGTAVESDQRNGSHPPATPSALALPALLDPPVPFLPSLEDDAEDDLWGDSLQEVSANAPEAHAETMCEETATQKETDVGENWKKEVAPEEQGDEAEEPFGVQDGPRGTSMPVETTESSLMRPQISAPDGTMIAALAAAPVWSQDDHQQALDRLTTLLSTMPATTILVDLRQHRPAPRGRRGAVKSRPQQLGLSKDLLRARYGGRYWERGFLIQTTRRLDAARPLHWHRVVLQPEDPRGLGELVALLARGFSLVLLDGERSYAESARAAVLAELRQRVANLEEGPCS